VEKLPGEFELLRNPMGQDCKERLSRLSFCVHWFFPLAPASDWHWVPAGTVYDVALHPLLKWMQASHIATLT